jgi:hypothetical protein
VLYQNILKRAKMPALRDIMPNGDVNYFLPNQKTYSVEAIKAIGIKKSDENLEFLLGLFNDTRIDFDVRREIVSSIGRQNDEEKILRFIKNNVFCCGFMELVYQMYRTCLYKQTKNKEFKILGEKIAAHFNNEMLNKMKAFYEYRHSRQEYKNKTLKQITKPTLLRYFI